MSRTKPPLPAYSQAKLRSIFRNRPLEDLDGLRLAEAILRKERGYVFKLPPKKTPVITLFSGGLDSTTTCALLMEEFGFEVYPVFFHTGFDRNRYEYQAASTMAELFSRRYGKLFHPVKVIEYAPLYPPVRQTNPIWDLPYDRLSNGIRCVYAMKYAYQLEAFDQVKIRTIFTSHISSDGELVSDQTLSSLRKVMVYLCMGTGDFSWQVSALGLEKELGYYYGKEFEIAWSSAHGIPLELTRTSCYRDGEHHCGECAYCTVRKEAFRKAGVTDTTVYANEYSLIERAISKAKRTLRSFTRGVVQS